jgi:hypothetical protein
MDDALRRKMAQELSGIKQTTFWDEFLKAIQGHRKYYSQTLEKESVEREIAKAQGSIFSIDRIMRLPRDLTGIEKSPDE